MFLFHNLILTLSSLALESVFGYPQVLYRKIGHPVSWMGGFLNILEQLYNQPEASAEARRNAGIIVLLIYLAPIGACGWVLSSLFGNSPEGLLALAFIGSSLLAQRSLEAHVQAVADALKGQRLAEARKKVAMIVGRNPDVLDEAGVARAAIESLAENFSDGVVAPAFWMVLLGLPGVLFYKAINTGDSMIGHRTERFAAFGWATARLDDLINLIPARLSALWLILAAAFLPQASAVQAWRAVRHDARHHRSPNAGWPEAAMAGALGLQLAGPRVYGDIYVADAFMGDGRREAIAQDIVLAIRLYIVALCLQAAALLALAVCWFLLSGAGQ